MKNVLIGIAIVLLLALGFFIGSKLDPKTIYGWFTTEQVKPGKDTLWYALPPPPPDTVVITKLKIKTITRDSIVPMYIDRAFTKIIDTTIREAKFRVEWYFPEDSSMLYYQEPPKEVAYIHDTLEIKTFNPVSVPSKYGISDFFKDLGLFLLGGIIGNQVK